MTAMSRLEALKQFAAQSPTDPFPHYGLAMELKNLGQDEAALKAFLELETRFPTYVAQYLMHGNLLIAMGRAADARGVLERGIVEAGKAGNQHALSELSAALEQL
jgi:hypothetical protein